MENFISIPDELFERLMNDPKGSKKLMVLARIRRGMDYKTGEAVISPEQLAKDFREEISERFIRDFLDELEGIGQIIKYGLQRPTATERKGTHIVFCDIDTRENEEAWTRAEARKEDLARKRSREKSGTQMGTQKHSKNAPLSAKQGTQNGEPIRNKFNQKDGGLNDVDNSDTGVRVDKSDHEGTKSEEFSPGAAPDPEETDGKAERMLRELHQLRAKRRGETA